MTTRRNFTRIALLGTCGIVIARQIGPALAEEEFEITRTEAEWRAMLTDEQYDILREEGTEYPATSDLLHEKRAGVFSCAGCGLDLFLSTTKYDSGTGWPSFWQPLDNAIATREDGTLGMIRTEVHCRRCGGHMGHVFNDGPEPTGLRYCINGVSLTFRPDAA